MSTNGDSEDQSRQRVGDADRQEAVTVLGEHWRAGRLDPAEHERRTTAAYQAVTRGDLEALFSDLPGGLPHTVTPSSGPAVRPAAPTPAGRPEPDVRDTDAGFVPAGSWLAGHRTAIMGVTPFAALVLFFVTNWWVWFLLIPVMGVVLYAGGDQDRRDRRDRRRRHDR